MDVTKTFLFATLAALGLAACSGEPDFRLELPDDPPEAVLISDVALLDVGRGVRVPGRDVLLRGGQIAAIGLAGQLVAPEGALQIAGAGATLVPGLVDLHGHVNASSAPPWSPGAPDAERNLRSYLYCGVTTVLDPGDPDGAFERRDRVAAGDLLGPRIFAAGPMHTAPGGHPVALVRQLAPWWIAWYVAPRSAVTLASVEEAKAAADARSAEGADFVKVTVDRLPADAPRLEGEVLAALVGQARSHGLRSVAHIGSTEDAIDAAEAGVAAWVHGVSVERIPDDQIGRLVGYGIPMVATLEVIDAYARMEDGPREPSRLERETVAPERLAAFDSLPADFELGPFRAWLDRVRETRAERLANVARLHAAGLTILAGSDTQPGVFPGPGLHRELHQLVRAGLTPMEAIQAATLHAARFLAAGAEPDFGDVAIGMRADLILVEGDPTEDVGVLESIRQVFLAGVPLEREARPPAEGAGV
jgi:imidazolonepropionase-like amidohydrolase